MKHKYILQVPEGVEVTIQHYVVSNDAIPTINLIKVPQPIMQYELNPRFNDTIEEDQSGDLVNE